MQLSTLTARIEAVAQAKRRVLVGIAGPPASGKSTLAARLGDQIDGAVVVPMDGFHLDNTVLEQNGLLARKGAPETFDASGFVDLVTQLRAGTTEVAVPEFDRQTDRVVDNGRRIPDHAKIILIEGNYLLLEQPIWRDLGNLFDLTICLAPSIDDIRARLIQRWRDHGFDADGALGKAEGNDLPNARLVLERSRVADIQIDCVDYA